MKKNLKRSLSLLLALVLCFSIALGGVPKAQAAADYWWLPYVENPEETFLAPGVDVQTGQVTSHGQYILLTSDVHRYAYLLKDLLALANDVVHEDSGTDANVGFLAMGGDYANEQDIYPDNMTIMKHAVEDNSPGTVVAYSKGNHEGNVTNDAFIEYTGMARVGETAVNADGLYYYYNWGAETSKQTFLTQDIDQLDQWLAAHNDGKPVFLVSHFPIHYYNERRTTKNADKLMDVLNKYPQVVFCWGHNHTENDPAYGTIRLPGDVIQCGADPATTTKELNFTYVNLGALRDGVNECNGLVAKVNPDHSVSYWYLGLGLEIDADGAIWTDAQGNDNPIRYPTNPRIVSTTNVDPITPESLRNIERTSISIERPRVDNLPAENAQVFSNRYVSGQIAWTTGGAPVSGPYDFDTAYTATLDLMANPGYSFDPEVQALVNFAYVGPMGDDYPDSDARILRQDDHSITLEYQFANTVKLMAEPWETATSLQDGHRYVLAATDDSYAAFYRYLYSEEEDRPNFGVQPVDVVIRDGNLVGIDSEVVPFVQFIAEKDDNGYLLYSDAGLKDDQGSTVLNFLTLGIRGGGELNLEASGNANLSIYNNWNIDEDGNPYLSLDGVICYPAFINGAFAGTTDPAECNVKLFDVGEDAPAETYVVVANVPLPQTGEAPAQGITWEPADEVFAPGTAYTVTVEVALDKPASPAAVGRINGNTAEMTVSEDGRTAKLSYTFGETMAQFTPLADITATRANALEDGKTYVIVSDGQAMTSALADGLYLAGVDVAEENGEITAGLTQEMLFTLEASDTEGTFFIKGSAGYLKGKQVGDSPDCWGLTISEEGALTVSLTEDSLLKVEATGAGGGPGGPGGPPPGGDSGVVNAFYHSNGHFNFTTLANDPVALYEVALSAVEPVEPAPAAFTDVAGHWAEDAIDFVARNGLFNGYEDGTFAPDAPMTRGMLVTVLWRLAGAVPAAAPADFADVAPDAWYADAVAWAQENNVVQGMGDGLFAPDGLITREQLAAMLYRYVQQQGQGFTGAWAFLLDYPDAESVSEYAYEPLCWMTMNQIIRGMGDGTLAPQGNATRAQVATMLMRFAELIAG